MNGNWHNPHLQAKVPLVIVLKDRKGQQKVWEGHKGVGIRLSSYACAMGDSGDRDNGFLLIASRFHFHFIITFSLTISRDKEILKGVRLD